MAPSSPSSSSAAGPPSSPSSPSPLLHSLWRWERERSDAALAAAAPAASSSGEEEVAEKGEGEEEEPNKNTGTGSILSRRGNLDVVSVAIRGGGVEDCQQHQQNDGDELDPDYGRHSSSFVEEEEEEEERDGDYGGDGGEVEGNLNEKTPPCGNGAEKMKVGICNLAALMPYSHKGEPWNVASTYDHVASMALAAHHLNTGDGSISPSLWGLNETCPVRFTLLPVSDTALEKSVAVDAVIDLTDPASPGPLPCAVYGALRSAVSVPTSIITGLRGYLQVSPGSSAVALDDRSQHPLFGRTATSDEGLAVTYVSLLKQLGNVRYVAVLHVDDDFGNSFVAGLRRAAAEMSPDLVVSTIDVPAEADDDTLKRAVELLKETKFTYFVGLVYDYQVNEVLTEAYELGIAGTGRHNWLLVHGYYVVPGATVKRNSSLDKAYRGTMTIGSAEYYPGFANSNLQRALRSLKSNEEDMDYIRSKLPNNGHPFADSEGFLSGPVHGANGAYDTVVAIGLAACDAVVQEEEGPSLQGQDHFRSFASTAFHGASGRVAFDNVTGTRDPASSMFLLRNYVVDEGSSNDTHAVYKGVTAAVFREGEWNFSGAPLVFNDGTSNVPLDLPPLDTEENFLTPSLRAGGLVMCGLVLLLALAFAGWTWCKGASAVVRRSQPIFLYLLCTGAFLMGASIIPLSFDGGICKTQEGCDAACVVAPWLLSVGFTLLFSALFTKTHRLNRILKAAGRFRKIVVTPWDVAKPMMVLLGVNILVLGLWTGLDPLIYETTVISSDGVFGRPAETYGHCASTNAVPYLVVLGVVNVGSLGFAVYEAARCKNNATDYDESGYIFKAMAGILVACFVGIPTLYIAHDSPRAFYYVLSSMVFLSCTLVLLLIFVPKILAKKNSDEDPSNSNNAHGHVFGLAAANRGSSFSGLAETRSSPSLGSPSSFGLSEPKSGPLFGLAETRSEDQLDRLDLPTVAEERHNEVPSLDTSELVAKNKELAEENEALKKTVALLQKKSGYSSNGDAIAI